MLKARSMPCHGARLLHWLGVEVLVHGSVDAQVNSSMMANKLLGGRRFFPHELGSRENGNKSLLCNDITLN